MLLATHTQAQSKKQLFDFPFEGVTISGVLNLPQNENPKGIVLMIHGSGRTNAVAQDWYSDIRETFVRVGYATYIWDKMGCGNSGGTFNINQPVHNSADEVIAAIRTLKKHKIPGAQVIGLYGGSRASWINPIVLSQYEGIAFWISVSGVDDKENFSYLLAENLRIQGVPQDSINLYLKEWNEAVRIHHSGGPYEAAVAATTNLSRNAFWKRFTNGGTTKEQYDSYQPTIMKSRLDAATGIPIVVNDFDQMLSQIDCPVLALFGEKDKHVDWRKTKALYEETLGKNTDLTMQSFPDCNHNIHKCETGGFYEFQDNKLPYKRCDGFLVAIASWLQGL